MLILLLILAQSTTRPTVINNASVAHARHCSARQASHVYTAADFGHVARVTHVTTATLRGIQARAFVPPPAIPFDGPLVAATAYVQPEGPIDEQWRYLLWWSNFHVRRWRR